MRTELLLMTLVVVPATAASGRVSRFLLMFYALATFILILGGYLSWLKHFVDDPTA